MKYSSPEKLLRFLVVAVYVVAVLDAAIGLRATGFAIMESYAAGKVKEYQTLIAALLALVGVIFGFVIPQRREEQRRQSETNNFAQALLLEATELQIESMQLREDLRSLVAQANFGSVSTINKESFVDRLGLQETLIATARADQLSKLGFRVHHSLRMLRKNLRDLNLDRRDVQRELAKINLSKDIETIAANYEAIVVHCQDVINVLPTFINHGREAAERIPLKSIRDMSGEYKKLVASIKTDASQ